MKIAVPKELDERESRVGLAPESVKKLVKAGVTVTVEAGAGARSNYADREYMDAGAAVEQSAAALLGAADLVLKVGPPGRNAALGKHEVELLREGTKLLCSFPPTRELDLVKLLAARKVTAFSTDLMPRITRAQAMDTLSSMANIAGYRAVLIAALELPKYFPMFMTAAGTVHAARVFIIGAGVAGLQAIATAKRLGAAVSATDTRKAVGEQIQSLGAKFIGVDTAEDAQTAGGYAKEMSQDFYRKQAELIAQQCAANDAVITTALIGGVTAPKLITEDMVKAMKPGSVIVDLAAPAGGNCTLTEPGRTVVKHGVKICAPLNLPGEMPTHASLLFGRNLTAFVLAFWNEKEKTFKLDLQDDIIKGALVTHDGQVMHGPTRDALSKA